MSEGPRWYAGDVPGQASTGGDSSEVGRRGARARVDDIRRSLAATAEAPARARLRVRLADVLAALGDAASAAAELKQAAVEAPPSAGLLLAVRVVAARLGADEAEGLSLAVRGGRAPKRSVSPRGAGVRPRSTRDKAAGASGKTRSSLPRVGASPPATSQDAPPPVPQPTALPLAVGQQQVDPRPEAIDAAFAALGAKKPVLARRLGEEAARAGGSSTALGERLRALVGALDAQGAKRESLRLARTLVETDGATESVAPVAPVVAVGDGLTAVADRAAQMGQTDLAVRWGADLGRVPALAVGVPSILDGSDGTPPARFRAAQRAALTLSPGAASETEATIERLVPLVGGGAAVGAAALELAERLSRTLGTEGAVHLARLLRVAFDGERAPRRRERLAQRWADALRGVGDIPGAIEVLERAIAEIPGGNTGALRLMRADLLRTMGRDADLCRALAADADLATGGARLALLAEQASILDRMGEPDGALEVRLGAIKDAPGDLGLLGPARRRLEAVGRLDRSLELATAAVAHVSDRTARASLLRDVATLAEAAAGDRDRAASAWLKVVSLDPGDTAAREAAERLLREGGDRNLLGELLAWSAARQPDVEARASLLWRLAEFRRVDQQSPMTALTLYREIIEARRATPDSLTFPDDDWQRRDNLLAMHTARAMAAPTASARAQAIADRVFVLMEVGRLDEADRDLGRALDLDPATTDVIVALERLTERRGDWLGLRQRLSARVEGATGLAAAHLWFGIGRANERLGETASARSAYERAFAVTDGFRLALTALRPLAAARADWAEVARLLEKEIELVTAPLGRVGLLVELGGLLADKLNRGARAVEVLDAALAVEPANPAALDAMFGAALGAGSWDKAAQALEAMLGAGINVPDAAQRYHRLGRAAETSGQVDRALGLYSRSYARNPAFRPTLERLSEICFERQQWDNAWKATEHLIERHGADLDPGVRAELATRSALADLHVAQRHAAANRIAEMLGGSVSAAGVRDVAESWASMRFDPRILRSVEGDRRARVLSRLGEVMALTETAQPGTAARVARSTAREALAALAVVDRRWADAVSLLDGSGDDRTLEPGKRCLFLITAGDILLHQQGDVAGAASRYQRARALNPSEPRLARSGIVQVGQVGQAGTEQATQPTQPIDAGKTHR